MGTANDVIEYEFGGDPYAGGSQRGHFYSPEEVEEAFEEWATSGWGDDDDLRGKTISVDAWYAPVDAPKHERISNTFSVEVPQ